LVVLVAVNGCRPPAINIKLRARSVTCHGVKPDYGSSYLGSQNAGRVQLPLAQEDQRARPNAASAASVTTTESRNALWTVPWRWPRRRSPQNLP
jgi:hypothetical protein